MSRRLVLISVVAALLIAAASGGYLVRGHLGRPSASPAPTSRFSCVIRRGLLSAKRNVVGVSAAHLRTISGAGIR